jgi:hypothetical protein
MSTALCNSINAVLGHYRKRPNIEASFKHQRVVDCIPQILLRPQVPVITENLVRTRSPSDGVADRGNVEAAKQRRSESQSGECKGSS